MSAQTYTAHIFDAASGEEVLDDIVRIAGIPLIRIGTASGIGQHLTASAARVLAERLLNHAHLITDAAIQGERL